MPMEFQCLGKLVFSVKKFNDKPFGTRLVPQVPLENSCNVTLDSDPLEVADTIAKVVRSEQCDTIFPKHVSIAEDRHVRDSRQQLMQRLANC